MVERPPCRVDVCRWIEERQRLKIRLRNRVICSGRPCESRESAVSFSLPNRLSCNERKLKVASGFLNRQLFDELAFQGELGMLAPQPFERRHDLVADEAVAFFERRDENVHRLLRRNLPQGARNMSAHPDVLFWIAEEERKRVHHQFAVRQERHARGL